MITAVLSGVPNAHAKKRELDAAASAHFFSPYYNQTHLESVKPLWFELICVVSCVEINYAKLCVAIRTWSFIRQNKMVISFYRLTSKI